MPLRLLLAAFAVLLLTQCAENPARVAATQVSTTAVDGAAAAKIISEYRTKRGLSPVSVDARLTDAAAVQARAVAQAGKLSHGQFASRMASFGIRGVSAENLTAGPGSVDQAVARWMASPSHNENLLMPEARRIGLARADTPGSGYQRYWALVLAD